MVVGCVVLYCSVEGVSVFMAYFVCVYDGWLCCSVEGVSVFMAYFVCVYGGWLCCVVISP